MTINERFALVLKTEGIKARDFAATIGKSEVYVRKLMRAGESFGLEPVLHILNSIESLNAEWLLLGRGDMFKTAPAVPQSSDATVERLLSIIESQQRTIETLAKK